MTRFRWKMTGGFMGFRSVQRIGLLLGFIFLLGTSAHAGTCQLYTNGNFKNPGELMSFTISSSTPYLFGYWFGENRLSSGTTPVSYEQVTPSSLNFIVTASMAGTYTRQALVYDIWGLPCWTLPVTVTFSGGNTPPPQQPVFVPMTVSAAQSSIKTNGTQSFNIYNAIPSSQLSAQFFLTPTNSMYELPLFQTYSTVNPNGTVALSAGGFSQAGRVRVSFSSGAKTAVAYFDVIPPVTQCRVLLQSCSNFPGSYQVGTFFNDAYNNAANNAAACMGEGAFWYKQCGPGSNPYVQFVSDGVVQQGQSTNPSNYCVTTLNNCPNSPVWNGKRVAELFYDRASCFNQGNNWKAVCGTNASGNTQFVQNYGYNPNDISNWSATPNKLALNLWQTDFDKDGKADFTNWNPGESGKFPVSTLYGNSNGIISRILSTTGQASPNWGVGVPGDILVPGDYDDDGKADFVVWRRVTAQWFGRLSSGTGTAEDIRILGQWGGAEAEEGGYVPVPGDYDGDGKTDLAYWQPSNATWYISGVKIMRYGEPGDVPVPGDYDGDGKTDLATYRPRDRHWRIVSSKTGYELAYVNLGQPGDIPSLGDYDGGGSTDIAMYNPMNQVWTIRSSETGQHLPLRQWGQAGDIPVPADYDGDGKTDLAIWRGGTTRQYHVLRSSNQQGFVQYAYSGPMEIPLPVVAGRYEDANTIMGLNELVDDPGLLVGKASASGLLVLTQGSWNDTGAYTIDVYNLVTMDLVFSRSRVNEITTKRPFRVMAYCESPNTPTPTRVFFAPLPELSQYDSGGNIIPPATTRLAKKFPYSNMNLIIEGSDVPNSNAGMLYAAAKVLELNMNEINTYSGSQGGVNVQGLPRTEVMRSKSTMSGADVRVSCKDGMSRGGAVEIGYYSDTSLSFFNNFRMARADSLLSITNRVVKIDCQYVIDSYRDQCPSGGSCIVEGLMSTLQHEVGHALGLADDYSNVRSIMSRFPMAISTPQNNYTRQKWAYVSRALNSMYSPVLEDWTNATCYNFLTDKLLQYPFDSSGGGGGSVTPPGGPNPGSGGSPGGSCRNTCNSNEYFDPFTCSCTSSSIYF